MDPENDPTLVKDLAEAHPILVALQERVEEKLADMHEYRQETVEAAIRSVVEEYNREQSRYTVEYADAFDRGHGDATMSLKLSYRPQ
jgi:hypothetical protein